MSHREGSIADLGKVWRAQADPDSISGAAWTLAHGARALIAPDPPLTLPTLVMTCENDSGSTPGMSRAVTAESSGADCQIIPGLKHLGLTEELDHFSGPALRFLDQQSA